ncbi:hypothetical protein [Shewanella algidipiscicola]|uniref:Uncharacterized protein n=1 Tax=Shewanella algidipiscicola TaxID=614070 RepID=A0ABQ4PI20_9GAMM|nr:hypothetical protein [Shewanella algidipiscicola]GIU47134.1 hypothetical protein TUM4630_20000 [Shewanella algidipiscicola]
MKHVVDKMLDKHDGLVHSEGVKILSHTQRETDEWVQHTVMIEGCDAPFKFKRTKKYRSLQGQKVNMTYYPEVETVAGLEFEVMKVVRIKRF